LTPKHQLFLIKYLGSNRFLRRIHIPIKGNVAQGKIIGGRRNAVWNLNDGKDNFQKIAMFELRETIIDYQIRRRDGIK